MIILRINYDVVKHQIRCVGTTKGIRICCFGRCAYRWGGEFFKPDRLPKPVRFG